MRRNHLSEKNGILHRYLSTLISMLSWRLGLAVGLMILVSLTEGIGLLLLLPLMQLVGLNVQQGSAGRLAELISSIFAAIGVPPTLIAVLVVFVLITVL